MLMVSNNRFILLLLIFVVSYGLSSAITIDEVYQQLTAKYDTIEYFAASFTQTNYWKIQDRLMESQGEIYIANQKMAIIFSSPPGQKMILDETLYLINEVERTMIITDMEHTGGLFKPNDIIDLYWNQSAKELIVDNEDTYKIVMIPEDDLYTARAEMIIRRSDFIIVGVSYEDHNKNRVDFNFHDERVNQRFDMSVFNVTPDKDYTIIDNRINIPQENTLD
ncbi:MAG: hypothetical protein K0B81_02355 [Candidatus Cloacimonetes bacterium]|nr:hypothetical protein [Candidatus Cloacimonadota bacterium]